MLTKRSVLITGASSGIGAVYADRFARRGHNLILVARNRSRMHEVGDRLRRDTGVSIDVLEADLTRPDDLAHVEARLRDDARIGVLINNAGTAGAGGFLDQSLEDVARVVTLNAMAPILLARIAGERFANAGDGAIVNIASVVGLMPEYGFTVYGATKALVLFLSQSLHAELSPKGVYVQAVVPAATRTEIWNHAGMDVNKLPAVMEAGELVDAALVGFDRSENVTIPSLPDVDQWNAFEAARRRMIPNFSQAHAAERYREAA